MTLLIDMSGRRVGRWTVLREAGRDRHGQALWLCRCDCGDEKLVTGGRLRRGESESCGCDKPRRCAEANLVHGHSARGRMTAEYRAWSNMIDRCERPGNKQYADWGARGITVCARWRESFGAFLADMGPRPSPAHSIDRIDNDGNYEPANCRWATRIEQARNKRNTLRIGGQTLAEVSAASGIGHRTLYDRIRRGLAPERITAPVRRTQSRKAA